MEQRRVFKTAWVKRRLYHRQRAGTPQHKTPRLRPIWAVIGTRPTGPWALPESIVPSVLQRLGEVVAADDAGSVKIRNRAGDAEDTVVPPGREREFRQGNIEDAAGLRVERTRGAELAAVEPGVQGAASRALALACRHDSCSN